MADPVKCSFTNLNDLYVMGQVPVLQEMLNTLRRYSEAGAQVIITDNYTDAHTRQEEERVLHRFTNIAAFDKWVKSQFPKLPSQDASEGAELIGN